LAKKARSKPAASRKPAASPRRTRQAATKPRPTARRKTSPRSTPPVCLEDAEQIDAIRTALKRSNYATAVSAAMSIDPAESQEAASEEHPMLRMFMRGARVAADEARAGLEPLPMEAWKESGLIDLRRGFAVPLARLEPYGHLIVASDLGWWRPDAAKDAVMGLTGSTLWLANLRIRRKSRLTLDVGTGTGIQALLAASHSDHVIATDVNARAIEFAKFNARLNGISNIEFLAGDLFEPAKGSKFDLILSNPPFVISPEFRTLCRDNTGDGDEFLQRIVATLPRHLNDEGFGQVFCDWAQIEGETWSVRLAKWFGESGCDALVLRTQTLHPAQYASNFLDGRDKADLQRLHRSWTTYLAKRRIESIGRGMITMRRASRRPVWVRADDLPKPVQKKSGDAIERAFGSRDFLDENDDKQLLDTKLRVSPHLRVESHLEPSSAGWGLRGARLVLTRGISYSAMIGPALMKAVLRCDGTHPLRDLLGGIGPKAGGAAKTRVENSVKAVRSLIANGFLWPAATGESDDENSPG